MIPACECTPGHVGCECVPCGCEYMTPALRRMSEARAALLSESDKPRKPLPKTVIHRGPIPGTNIGHHWFTDVYGERFGIGGSPHGINKGWSYEVFDEQYRTVDDSMFSFAEIREWAGR